MAAVLSVEPSSTTMISMRPGSRSPAMEDTVAAIPAASL